MKEIAFWKVSQLMNTSPLTFSAMDTVSKFLGSLQKLDFYEALVVSKKKVGIVTALDALDTSHPERTLLGNIARRAPSLSPEAIVLEAIDLMVSNELGVLPIMKNRKVIGMISCVDVLNAMAGSSVLENIMCKDVMKLSKLWVREDEKVSTARSIMCRHKVCHLPVINKENQLKGIITARDIAFILVQSEDSVTRGEFVGESMRIWDASVKGFIDLNPVIAEKEDLITDIVKSFKNSKKKVCIIGESKEFGIITPMEIIALLLKLKTEEMVHVRFLGSPFYSDFLSMKTVRDKIIRVLGSGFIFHEGVREVIIDVKQRKQSGERTLYQVIARIYLSGRPLVVSAQGWYLADAINKLCSKLDRVLRKSKKRRPRAPGRYASK